MFQCLHDFIARRCESEIVRLEAEVSKRLKEISDYNYKINNGGASSLVQQRIYHQYVVKLTLQIEILREKIDALNRHIERRSFQPLFWSSTNLVLVNQLANKKYDELSLHD